MTARKLEIKHHWFQRENNEASTTQPQALEYILEDKNGAEVMPTHVSGEESRNLYEPLIDSSTAREGQETPPSIPGWSSSSTDISDRPQYHRTKNYHNIMMPNLSTSFPLHDF